MNKMCYTKQNKKAGNSILWLRILISLLLMGILVFTADPVKIKQSLLNFRQLSLIPVFSLIALSMFISALKWKVLLDAQKNRIGLLTLFRIYVTSLFFNNFLPSSIGGDGMRIYLAGRYCGSISSAASSVVVERAIATVSLSMLGLSGFLFAEKISMPALWLLVFVLVAGMIVTFIILTGWTPGFIKKRGGRISDAWLSFSETSGELKNKPAALIVTLILSLVFQVNVAMVAASVIWGIGLPVPHAADMFFITSASSVLAMVPAGINGYGLRESAYIILLMPYGFTTSSALTVSVLFALFVSVFSLAGGVDWMLSSREYSNPAETGRLEYEDAC